MAAMNPDELLTAWENAYLDQCQTARVGSLFRGTIHNLNGIVQAFSMQSELFAMMFVKTDRLLDEALNEVQDSTVRDKILQVREIMQKRQRTLEQVEEKILLSQDILKNNDDIRHNYNEGSSATLQSIVDNVVSFFNSHMFFKHKVKKEVSVNADLSLGDKAFAMSVVLANVVENSIQAMEQNVDEEARFVIRAGMRDDTVLIEIEDNGIGIPEEIREKVFEEFTTATANHHGLGLYQAKKLVGEMGGEIEITSPVFFFFFFFFFPVGLGKD